MRPRDESSVPVLHGIVVYSSIPINCYPPLSPSTRMAETSIPGPVYLTKSSARKSNREGVRHSKPAATVRNIDLEAEQMISGVRCRMWLSR